MTRVHLVNPSSQSFGVAVITPRWLYVLAAATGTEWGDPRIVDETLAPLAVQTIEPGDVRGIGIHTGNARRGDRDRIWSQVVADCLAARPQPVYEGGRIATDSARVQRSARRAQWIGHACRRLFLGKPMPDRAFPGDRLEPSTLFALPKAPPRSQC